MAKHKVRDQVAHQARMAGQQPKPRMTPAEFKRACKNLAMAHATNGSGMGRDLYYGSKCDKPDSRRRPFKGGQVHS